MSNTHGTSRVGVALRAGALGFIAIALGAASLARPMPAERPGTHVISAAHAGEPGALERAADEVSTITDEVLDWAESVLDEVRQAVASPTADAQRAVAESIGLRVLSEPVASDGSASGPDAGDGSALDWQRPAEGSPTPARLVVLVHGLDEPGDIWDQAAPAIRSAGLRVARFDYPNDQSIAASADALAEALRGLRARGTQRVDLVCHSMGGLIARDLLTRDAHYAGDARGGDAFPSVERVITVGTPNFGAPLAPLRGLTEMRDQLARLVDDDDITLGDMLRFASDGNGEAGIDLAPGSDFLTDLNARPLPTGARWTIIIGQVATPEDVGALSDNKLARAMGVDDDLDELIEILAPITRDFGDGAVPSDSAPLPGVDDTVRIVGNHRSMLRTIAIEHSLRKALGDTPAETPPAIPIILDRLAAPTGPAAPAPGSEGD